MYISIPSVFTAAHRKAGGYDLELTGGWRVQATVKGPECTYVLTRKGKAPGYPRTYVTRADAEMHINTVALQAGSK